MSLYKTSLLNITLAIVFVGVVIVTEINRSKSDLSPVKVKHVQNYGSSLWEVSDLSDGRVKSSHAPFIAEDENGIQHVFWFGGTREGHKDVQIFHVQLTDGQILNEPVPILSASQLSELSGRYVKKIGNPVVWFQDDRLIMAVVNVSVGGWATSKVDLLVSEDLGNTFTFVNTLRTSPFFNLSTLVRNRPIENGNGYLLPAYFELNRLNPLFIQLDSALNIQFTKTERAASIQPSLMQTEEGYRYFARPIAQDKFIQSGQVTGSKLQSTVWQSDSTPESPSSALDVVELAPDYWLMVHNLGGNRSHLALSTSKDSGKTWRFTRTIENEAGKSFAYPSFIKDKNGLIHLVYSEDKSIIRYTRFSVEALL